MSVSSLKEEVLIGTKDQRIKQYKKIKGKVEIKGEEVWENSLILLLDDGTTLRVDGGRLTIRDSVFIGPIQPYVRTFLEVTNGGEVDAEYTAFDRCYSCHRRQHSFYVRISKEAKMRLDSSLIVGWSNGLNMITLEDASLLKMTNSSIILGYASEGDDNSHLIVDETSSLTLEKSYLRVGSLTIKGKYEARWSTIHRPVKLTVLDSETHSPSSAASVILYGYLPKHIVELAPEYKDEPPLYPYYTLTTDLKGEVYMDILFEIFQEPVNYLLAVSKGSKHKKVRLSVTTPNNIVVML